MEKLQQAFQRAERWVKRSARPLEAARWDYAFSGDPVPGCLTSLLLSKTRMGDLAMPWNPITGCPALPL